MFSYVQSVSAERLQVITTAPAKMSCDDSEVPYIPPMNNTNDNECDTDDNALALEPGSQDIGIDDAELISANSPNSKVNESPSAAYSEPSEPVLFQIKEYELNEEGIPILSNIEQNQSQKDIHNNKMNEEVIGEILIDNNEEDKCIKRVQIEDAEPDPINYDENHWKQYDENRRINNGIGFIIGCRLRVFQCFSFFSCLLSIVALLTDNLTEITGQHQYGYYNDTIICGWNSIHMIEYDVSIGITQTVIQYDDKTICNQNGNHQICQNLWIRGLIWLISNIIAIVVIFTVLVLFCCVFPLKPIRFEDHKRASGLFMVLNVIFQVIAVIIWVSNDYCYDQQFIRTFYDKHIESILIGTSIDVMIGSMLCGLICILLIVCYSFIP